MWIGGGASEGEKQNAMGYAHVSITRKKKVEYHTHQQDSKSLITL